MMASTGTQVDRSFAELLDSVAAGLLQDAQDACLQDLAHELHHRRSRLSPTGWRGVAAQVRSHPLHRALLQSPITGRAFAKPRGYAGDAVLLDAIYGTGARPLGVSTVGQAVYAFEYESRASQSVRARRVRLAREIDGVAGRQAHARVLSLACGHLREIELSAAVREGRVSLSALDQDAASVTRVERDYGSPAVTARVGTVLDAIRGRLPANRFHLVYTAGLYDYLAADVAAALTASLFACLEPGGQLLLANFTPDFDCAAYLEACQDWNLIYRDEAEMVAMLHRIPGSAIASCEQFREWTGAITYLRVRRR
ncbi:MAG: hypothetical protein AB7I25_08635 [Vicinamibacterales bacterium]